MVVENLSSTLLVVLHTPATRLVVATGNSKICHGAHARTVDRTGPAAGPVDLAMDTTVTKLSKLFHVFALFFDVSTLVLMRCPVFVPLILVSPHQLESGGLLSSKVGLLHWVVMVLYKWLLSREQTKHGIGVRG